MYQNPSERGDRAIYIPLKNRIDGLNAIAKLRAIYFKRNNEKLGFFLDDMKNKHDEMYEEKRIFLAGILRDAGIKKERMNLDIDKFSKEEINSIIKEINRRISFSNLLPKGLSLVE
ncbi:DUF5347 family protein [Proteus mirabilis]|nr:DUF5347 family protein [Proteus mirabilis]